MTTRSDPTLTAMCVLLLASSAACRSEARSRAAERAAGTTTGAAGSAAAADTGQRAMAGEMTGMHRDTLAASVEAHLQRLATSNPDSLEALVPVDREVVTTLIADCEKMMREMKINPPGKWRDAVKDLRQDLDRMAAMSGAQLRSAVPEHRKRIENMLSMRRDMMRM